MSVALCHGGHENTDNCPAISGETIDLCPLCLYGRHFHPTSRFRLDRTAKARYCLLPTSRRIAVWKHALSWRTSLLAAADRPEIRVAEATEIGARHAARADRSRPGLKRFAAAEASGSQPPKCADPALMTRCCLDAGQIGLLIFTNAFHGLSAMLRADQLHRPARPLPIGMDAWQERIASAARTLSRLRPPTHAGIPAQNTG